MEDINLYIAAGVLLVCAAGYFFASRAAGEDEISTEEQKILDILGGAEGATLSLNQKYSYKSWKYQDLRGVDPKEFNDTEIIGASFYQRRHHTDALPTGIKNCRLVRCNCDNLNIPAGFTFVSGTNKHIEQQKDKEFWIVDVDGKPLEPRDKAKFESFGISTNPVDISPVQLTEPVTFTNDPLVVKMRKIEELKNDNARLEQILIEKGEL